MLVPFEVQLSFNHCSVHSGFRDGFDGVDASTAKSSEDLVQPTFGCFGFIRTQIGGDRHGDLLCKQRGFCPAASEALTPWQAEMCRLGVVLASSCAKVFLYPPGNGGLKHVSSRQRTFFCSPINSPTVPTGSPPVQQHAEGDHG